MRCAILKAAVGSTDLILETDLDAEVSVSATRIVQRRRFVAGDAIAPRDAGNKEYTVSFSWSRRYADREDVLQACSEDSEPPASGTLYWAVSDLNDTFTGAHRKMAGALWTGWSIAPDGRDSLKANFRATFVGGSIESQARPYPAGS